MLASPRSSCGPSTLACRTRGAVVLCLALASCASTGGTPTAPVPPVEGLYRGQNESGTTLELSLIENELATTGHGQYGSTPVAFLESGERCLPGHLVFASGTVVPVRLSIQPSGELSFELSDEDWMLAREGEAEPATSGPFEGTFRSRSGVGVGGLILTQDGSTIVGTANALGQHALVAAWVGKDGGFHGRLLFEDQSTVLIEGREENGELTLLGFGPPIVMRRTGGVR